MENTEQPLGTAPQGTVLVIDDDPPIGRLLAKAFRRHVNKTLVCSNIDDAMQIIREARPDLIILDIHFPPTADDIQRDGFWPLEWINQVAEIKYTPVIMISGDDAVTTRPKALAAGADAFIQKPLHLEELINVTVNLITLSYEATS